MEYPVVKDAHIVPKCLLSAFAVDERVELHVDNMLVPGPVPIRDVAVRHTYYRRTRPDGSPIDDAEWSLNKIENAAAPLLHSLNGNWDSLSVESKGTLAEFFAIQSVRGPRWKAWWKNQTHAAVDRWRREPAPMLHNERQWFEKPGGSAPVADGYQDPIAPDVLSGYSKRLAESSRLRAAVTANLQPKLGLDQVNEIDVFTIELIGSRVA